MHKKRIELDEEPHRDTGKLRLKMLADHIQRDKEEADLELFNPDQRTKADEVFKKVLMFTEQLENVEYYIKEVRSSIRNYLTKVTEGRKYSRDPLPQDVDTTPVIEPLSATPAMDMVQRMKREKKSKDADSGNESEEVLSGFAHRTRKKRVHSKGSISGCTSKEVSQGSTS